MKQRIRKIKRIITAVIGFSFLFIGILLIFLPGPALIIIPLGLSILATEFVWARKLLNKIKKKVKKKSDFQDRRGA